MIAATLIAAGAAVAIAAMLCLAALKAWRGWLELRRMELARGSGQSEVGLRIELAALRERLKRLEEIASGVEL